MATKDRRWKSYIKRLRRDLENYYIRKYYNLFLNSFEINGLNFEQVDFVFDQLWNRGTVAGFPIKNTDEVAFVPYATETFNLYRFPETVRYVNIKPYPILPPFIPQTVQVVGKDCAIGFIHSTRLGIFQIIEPLIERIVTAEMVINTNLQTHKMPFLVGATPANKVQLEDLLCEIFEDSPAILAEINELNDIQTFSTAAPYIIDKLYAYKISIENEILTTLGIDNAQMTADSKELTLDQVNANNDNINLNRDTMVYHLEMFFDMLNEIAGTSISVTPRQKPVQSVYEETGREVAGGDNGGTEDNGGKGKTDEV